MPEFIYEMMHGVGGTFVQFIIPFIFVLSVLVFVHEWGHYIVARLCGVKVETFSIGFGKELFGWEDKHGTRWKVSLIPLGGYVKMFGDVDPASGTHTDEIKSDDKEHSRPMTADEKDQAFFAKPVSNRAAIVFAGPAINFIFAIILLAGLYMTVGKPEMPPIAAGVLKGGVAESVGMLPGDEITSIDGKIINSFGDIQRRVAISLDRAVEIELMRDDREIVLDGVTPEILETEDRFGFHQSRGLIGIIGPAAGVGLDNLIRVGGQDVSGLTNAEKLDMFDQMSNGIVEVTFNDFGDETQTILFQYDRANNTESMFEQENADDAILRFSPKIETWTQHYGPLQAVFEAFHETGDIIVSTFEALGQIFSGERSTKELGGIIRIGAVAGDAAEGGIAMLLVFTAMLSINLGLINLFPIPLLDGGHLVFYAAEALRGKPIPEKIQTVALQCGMFVLISLMLFANLNDLVQLVF